MASRLYAPLAFHKNATSPLTLCLILTTHRNQRQLRTPTKSLHRRPLSQRASQRHTGHPQEDHVTLHPPFSHWDVTIVHPLLLHSVAVLAQLRGSAVRRHNFVAKLLLFLYISKNMDPNM